MAQIFSNKDMEELFTQSSHHYSNSVIYTSQNYFNSKKDQTIIRENLSSKINVYSTCISVTRFVNFNWAICTPFIWSHCIAS